MVLCHVGSATRLRDVAVTVQRALRYYDTRHSSTLQRGRRHRKGFGPPRGRCCGRERGGIGICAKGSVGHVVRR